MTTSYGFTWFWLFIHCVQNNYRSRRSKRQLNTSGCHVLQHICIGRLRGRHATLVNTYRGSAAASLVVSLLLSVHGKRRQRSVVWNVCMCHTMTAATSQETRINANEPSGGWTNDAMMQFVRVISASDLWTGLVCIFAVQRATGRAGDRRRRTHVPRAKAVPSHSVGVVYRICQRTAVAMAAAVSTSRDPRDGESALKWCLHRMRNTNVAFPMYFRKPNCYPNQIKAIQLNLNGSQFFVYLNVSK